MWRTRPFGAALRTRPFGPASPRRWPTLAELPGHPLVQLWSEAGLAFDRVCPRRCGSPTSLGRRGWPPGSCRPIEVISKRPHKVRARSRIARGVFYSRSSAKGCAQSSPPASRPIGLLGGAPAGSIGLVLDRGGRRIAATTSRSRAPGLAPRPRAAALGL